MTEALQDLAPISGNADEIQKPWSQNGLGKVHGGDDPFGDVFGVQSETTAETVDTGMLDDQRMNDQEGASQNPNAAAEDDDEFGDFGSFGASNSQQQDAGGGAEEAFFDTTVSAEEPSSLPEVDIIPSTVGTGADDDDDDDAFEDANQDAMDDAPPKDAPPVVVESAGGDAPAAEFDLLGGFDDVVVGNPHVSNEGAAPLPSTADDLFGDFGCVSEQPVSVECGQVPPQAEKGSEPVHSTADDSNTEAGTTPEAVLTDGTKVDAFGDFAAGADTVEQIVAPAGDDFVGVTASSASTEDELMDFGQAPEPTEALAEKEDDAFGDFGAAAQPESSPEPATTTVVSEQLPELAEEVDGDDDFRDFGAAPAISKPSEEADDDFGDFGATPVVSKPDGEDGDVDFGDFGGAVADVSKPAESEDVDDGFGDLGGAVPDVSKPAESEDADDDFGDFDGVPDVSKPAETEDADGDFGDFGAAPPAQTSDAPNDLDDDDGFGDFGEAPAKPAVAPVDEDDFGDFGEAAELPKATMQADSAADDDDDEFGDFGEAAEAPSPAVADDDDEFGDFGEAAEASAPATAQSPVPQDDGNDDDFGDFNESTTAAVPAKPEVAAAPVGDDPIIARARPIYEHLFRVDGAEEPIGGPEPASAELKDEISVADVLASISSERQGLSTTANNFIPSSNGAWKSAPPRTVVSSRSNRGTFSHFSIPLGGFAGWHSNSVNNVDRGRRRTKRLSVASSNNTLPEVLNIQLPSPKGRGRDIASPTSSRATVAASPPEDMPGFPTLPSSKSPSAQQRKASWEGPSLAPQVAPLEHKPKQGFDAFAKQIPDLSFMLSSALSTPDKK